jgi:hypothetical protein
MKQILLMIAVVMVVGGGCGSEDNQPVCQWCKESVKAGAKVCPHCLRNWPVEAEKPPKPLLLIGDIERRADNLTYVKGEITPYTGMVHKYFDDDTLWETVNYIEGLREGERKVWHINGNVALNETYQNGILITAASFNFNGVPSGNYESGRGKLTVYFNHSGTRNEELEYEGGQISKRTIWDHNGKFIAIIPPTSER